MERMSRTTFLNKRYQNPMHPVSGFPTCLLLEYAFLIGLIVHFEHFCGRLITDPNDVFTELKGY